jgi:TolB protein
MRLSPCCLLFLLAPAVVLAGDDAVGQFSHHADIGAPAIAGSAGYDSSLQHYRMSAAGINLWGPSDQFHFAWNTLKGDFIVRARVEFVGQGVDPHRKYGWMARASLDADAPYVDACVHGDGLTSIQYRRTKGGETAEVKLALTGGDVVQLERRGDTYVFSSARYGEIFQSAQLADAALGDELQVGLFLCSHNPAVKEEAIFKDVRIIRPAPVGFRPYQDYIGSQLEVLNVHTGQLQLLCRSAEPFEAPNWMHDGRTLILNISGTGPDKGRLRTYDLKTGRWAPLDTGFAVKNNNDHVLSFDGTQLAISHHSADDEGRSVVYTLPATGGAPQRITPRSPSYLHGWSPDGQWLTFTGGRDGAYDIYKIPAAGGDEIRLTTTPGLDDGPEFSPDGAWIYFNSTRSGRMQLWRMRPDGSAPEQLTDDAFNNWFPHVSPDGKWIAFISYGPDVRPDEHPYYKHAYLRLMPAGGGTPRVIAYVYGGQGTLNVPSWSPDSTRLAFVTNLQVDE